MAPNKRRLGTTDLQITTVGFGAWAIGGGGWAYGWGPQDDAGSIAAIHHALELGINWIDTAAVYGLGHSEEVVARALRGRQERPFVFTKCERVWDDKGKVGPSLKRDSIRRECEASRARLQVDVIGAIACALPIWATLKFETPICRTFPSDWSSARAVHPSSMSSSGSGQ